MGLKMSWFKKRVKIQGSNAGRLGFKIKLGLVWFCPVLVRSVGCREGGDVQEIRDFGRLRSAGWNGGMVHGARCKVQSKRGHTGRRREMSLVN